MSYNEWQKEGSPLGPSSAVADAGLNRRHSRRHTPRVKASARSSFSSSAQFAHPRYGDEDFFLWPPEGRESRRHSRAEENNKFRDLATPTLLHFGNAQASLALRSTSAASIMGEVRYCQRLRTQLNKLNEVSNSLMKTFFTGLDSIQRCSVPLTGYPQEAEERFVATERNAKLRYEGYKKLSEM